MDKQDVKMLGGIAAFVVGNVTPIAAGSLHAYALSNGSQEGYFLESLLINMTLSGIGFGIIEREYYKGLKEGVKVGLRASLACGIASVFEYGAGMGFGMTSLAYHF